MDEITDAVQKVARLGSRTSIMLSVSVPFIVIAWITFALRVYVRAYMLRAVGKDDWAIALTLVIYSASVGLMLTIYEFESNGRPQRALTEGPLKQLEMLNELMTYILTGMGTYILSTVTLKISLAIFFLRIVVEKWHRWVIYVVTLVYTMFGVSFAFIAVFQCGNPERFLIKEYTHKCLGNSTMQPLNFVHGALNAASDLVFVLLPIAVLWHSKLPLPAKISAGLLLSLGGLGSISSLIRMRYIPGLKSGPAFFNNAVETGIWSIIEPGLGIIAACLATLRPLFKSMVERTTASSNTSPENSTAAASKGSLMRKAIPAGFSEKGYLRVEAQPVSSLTSPTTKSPAYEMRELSPTEEDFPTEEATTRCFVDDDAGATAHAPAFNTTAPLSNTNVDHEHTSNATTRTTSWVPGRKVPRISDSNV